MIERLRSSGSQDATVWASVDLTAPAVVESDGDSTSSLSDNEVKDAIGKHVPPYVPPVSGFVVCRTKAKLRR